MCLELRYPKFMYFKLIFIIEDFIQFPSMFYNVKSIFLSWPCRVSVCFVTGDVGGFFCFFF